MSLYDYRVSQQLSGGDPPFAAFIMAALRKADTGNAARLRLMWPDICTEMEERYNTPDGLTLAETVARSTESRVRPALDTVRSRYLLSDHSLCQPPEHGGCQHGSDTCPKRESSPVEGKA